MFPDTDIHERRLQVLHALPWPIPASVLMQFTDEDLDLLAAACGADEYWHTLNAIVSRISLCHSPHEPQWGQ